MEAATSSKQGTIGGGKSRSTGLVTATRVDWWRELPNCAIINQGGENSDSDEPEAVWETRDEAAVPTHDGGGLAWYADDDDDDEDLNQDGAGKNKQKGNRAPQHRVWASAQSLSTYPLLPTGQRDGDPNADCAWVRLYPNRAFVALADGCNWGHRPREAARSAVAALRDYLTRRCAGRAVPDLHEAAHYLLRAFAEADRRIMEGKGDTWEAGTTTLIGGLLLQLASDDNDDSSNNAGGDAAGKGKGKSDGQRPAASRWGFVCCSVGDCKAFHYAPARGGGGEVTDITAGNRMNVTDVRDPGGRLGPYLEGGAPDLRNLKLYFMPCEPGDVLLLVSDGVHDNFDPQMLGRLPSEIGLELPSDVWEDPNATGSGQDSLEVEVAKDRFRAQALQQLIEAGPLTPKAITARLIDHCYATTKVCREYMEHNPQARQPTDYRKFPGKMDHTTAACLIVPSTS